MTLRSRDHCKVIAIPTLAEETPSGQTANGRAIGCARLRVRPCDRRSAVTLTIPAVWLVAIVCSVLNSSTDFSHHTSYVFRPVG